MKIAETYSHLNGLEFLLVHKPKLWKEIKSVIREADPEAYKIKKSKGKGSVRELKSAPIEMDKQFFMSLKALGWTKKAEDQKKEIVEAGHVPIMSYNQTDFVKDRVAIEVQFGKYSFVAYDLFVKHLAFYIQDEIDVGVEILAMKSMQSKMSSGPAYYEGELYNVVRNGRGVPAVPLVILGVTP